MSWTYSRSFFDSDHLGETLFTYEGESEEDASEAKAVLISLGGASIEQEDRFLYVSMPPESTQGVGQRQLRRHHGGVAMATNDPYPPNAAVEALRDTGIKTPENVWTDICVHGFTWTAEWYGVEEQKLRDTVSVFFKRHHPIPPSGDFPLTEG